MEGAGLACVLLLRWCSIALGCWVLLWYSEIPISTAIFHLWSSCDLCKKNDENANHIILSCDFARQFWARLGWRMEEIGSVENLWCANPAEGTHPKATSSLIHLWKHRHDVVFWGLHPSVDRLEMTCKTTAALWHCHIPTKSRLLSSFWRSIVWMYPPPNFVTGTKPTV